MKRTFCVVVLMIILLLTGNINVFAESSETENSVQNSVEELSDSFNLNDLYDKLPQDTKDALSEMGITNAGTYNLDNVTISSVLSSILKSTKEQSTGVLKSFCLIISVILIYALFDGFSHSLTGDSIREVLNVVCALCLACALVLPATEVIDAAVFAISSASDFMLAFVPVMAAVLVTCGKSLSSSGYHALMITAAELISQLCDKVISPMLNVFLGVSLCGTIVPQVNLSGLTGFFSKTVKWLLSFTFTIFSALLTFKTLISTSIDTVSTRAVRYTVSSFIPVVGTALAEAYKTVQGSVNILKTGMGVFVIFAVAAVFLPVICKLLLWLFSVNLCKTFAQMINLNLPVQMLSGVSTVLSVLFAVIICIMALCIISTALIITAGGNSV